MNELWKPIKGYEDQYEISNKGRVKSLKRTYIGNGGGEWTLKERILKPSISKAGYVKTVLCKNGKPKSFLVHRLVAIAFLKNPENKPEVNHKDGDKLKNWDTNLEWCTRLENTRHAIKTKLRNTEGERHGCAKLSRKEVLEARSVYAQGWANPVELSEAYNITANQMRRILQRKAWKHI